MKNTRFENLSLFLAAIVCFSVIFSATPLLAADPAISLGGGVALVPDYEGSEDYTGAPALLFSARWESGNFIKFAGTSLRANVLPNKTWSLGPVLQYRGERNDDVSNNQVADMRKIDSTIEAGAFVGFNAEGFDAGLEWVTDTSNKHDGALAKMSAGYSFHWLGLANRVGISATYADDDYMDTYFSVDANNAARSGLDVYEAEAGIKDFGVDVTASYSINNNWSLMGLLGVKALLNDAKDSPVVDDVGSSSQLTAGLMAVYHF
ncbi:MAG: MipA/OmpV family protein [Desulfuromusa sp.]|nr:MipA/OmpV family protein [Desulfuromusa sp.]